MESLVQSLSAWGYLLVFGMVFFECAGLPLPGFTTALVAAALAGQGNLAFPLVFSATLLGSTLGGMLGFWIGLHGGRSLLERFGRYVLLTPPRLALAEKRFQQHGSKAIIFGRYLPLLCFLAGIISGAARLPYRRFLLYNFVGALLWCSTQLSLGYLGGRGLDLLSKVLDNFYLAGGVAVAVVVLVVLARHKLHFERRPGRPLHLPGDKTPE